jgi:hypothetical protein
MKKREFNKLLKEISGKDGLLSSEKMKQLDNDARNNMIGFIVRKRMPIVTGLLNEKTDMEWLGAMGYLYYEKGKRYNFLCTSENQQYVQRKLK